jgi:hypothetical protein
LSTYQFKPNLLPIGCGEIQEPEPVRSRRRSLGFPDEARANPTNPAAAAELGRWNEEDEEAMTKRCSQVVGIASVFIVICGCSSNLPNRAAIVAGAQEIAECPDFATSKGGGGSVDPEEPYFTQGSFLVSMKDYRTDAETAIDQDGFLWEVFTRYGEFVKSKIDYDEIPNMIAKGGSSQSDPRSSRYDFMFVSRDVSVGYDATWFRGGPNDPENSMPEVQVIYHIRVN